MSQAEEERVEDRPDPLEDSALEAIAADAIGDPAGRGGETGADEDAGPIEPIAARCDRLGLDVPARLRLFQAACRMVHRAHQRGRIFGDLRPSRLGTTAAGEPAEIAAGEADPDALDACTSPEQVLGEAPTTAADVYALGAVLYELLTGRPPIAVDPADPSATALAISEQAPERPGRAATGERRREIGADLDAIVLEAIRKEPERRHASAAALADDLDAYLAGLPVRAARTSEWGRVVRFVRRRRWVAAALAATVVGMLAWGGWEAFRARSLLRERDRAAAAAASARAAMATALDRLADDEAAEGDARGLRRELLEAARGYYEGVVAAAGRSPETLAEAADARTRVATIDGALGRKPQAAAGFRTAADLWKYLAARHLGDAGFAERLAESRAGLGRALDPGGAGPAADAALASLESARAGYLALADARPDEPRIRRRLARVMHDQAVIQRRQKQGQSALGSIRSAIRLLEELSWAEPGRPETRIELASAYALLARTMSDREDGLPTAALALDRAIQVLDATPGPAKDLPRIALDTAARLVDMADLQQSAGQAKPAAEAMTRATAVLEGLAAKFPADPAYRAELASAYNLDSEMLRGRGQRAEAMARAEKAQALLERLTVERPDEPRDVTALAFSRQLRGRLLAQEGRLAEALKAFQGAADLLEGLKERDADDAYALACNLSLGLTLIGVKDGGKPIEDAEDPALGPHDRLRRNVYARRAVSALRQAVAQGFDRLDVYLHDPALDPLRPRADFKKLLADLAAKQSPAG
ncbi:hypothetical protein [Paludisphaera mucosa]|uniref:Protein kinase domain-containing protein n=1 Tax=Paludisphaera mucosa TaxID=3030827 RepID=A0ABT6FBN7_9BACT|nr:hypothetical protein [Paludisphaera mucosa]MDG3004916.1 hypothetical protein [Paludisphaera mucosa]